jgi:hypothetical protein
VKKDESDEIVLLNAERSPIFLMFFVLSSAALLFASWQLLKIFNPWGFIVAIPAAMLSFQSLWLLLNPFAKIFSDRFEIKQSFVHRKTRYFVDIKKVTQKPSGKLYITFNDDDVERVNLFGIRSSHLKSFSEKITEFVSQGLTKRK